MQVRKSAIPVQTEWGMSHHSLLTHQQAATTLAVLFPGKNHGCDIPLLWYARKAVLCAGCDVLSLEYGHTTPADLPFMEQVGYLVEEAAAAIRQTIQPTHERLLLISKSMGTLVAGEVANRYRDRAISHLFLTPLSATLPYLMHERGILFTGTADRFFGAECVNQIRGLAALEVVEVPHAGHSLELDDDVQASLQVLGQVCEACARLAG